MRHDIRNGGYHRQGIEPLISLKVSDIRQVEKLYLKRLIVELSRRGRDERSQKHHYLFPSLARFRILLSTLTRSKLVPYDYHHLFWSGFRVS